MVEFDPQPSQQQEMTGNALGAMGNPVALRELLCMAHLLLRHRADGTHLGRRAVPRIHSPKPPGGGARVWMIGTGIGLARRIRSPKVHDFLTGPDPEPSPKENH